MKVILLQPPIEDFYDTDIRLQPAGLCSIKAAVRKHLPEVWIAVRDFHRPFGRRTVPLPAELSYLREYYPFADRSPFSLFYQYWRFGADLSTIVESVAGEEPEIVGISSLFSPYYREVLEIARGLKERMQAKIVLGGSHVSAMPERMLSETCVDFIIRGEGERPFVELLRALGGGADMRGVPGLGWKENGRLILNELGENYPLEELPIPDMSDLEPGNYTMQGKPLAFIITSRSCPHRCSFCSVHTTFGHAYRRRPAACVLEEIRARYTEGYRVFDFEDDNLTYYKNEFKELCRLLIREFAEKDARFTAMNGISYLSLDEELLSLMREAKFSDLNVALVSSDRAVRESTKRPHTTAKYIETVTKALQLGFHVTSYQILGLPGETLDSMIQTMCFASRFPVLLGASPFYLTPASPIARQFPEPDDASVFLSRLSAMAVETPDFRRRDIYTLFAATRIINFIKSIPVQSGTGLREALDVCASSDSKRTRTGGKLLEILFAEGRLCGVEGDRVRELPKFQTDLFMRLWSSLESIACLKGGRVLPSRSDFTCVRQGGPAVLST